jgi:antitoxin MazE
MAILRLYAGGIAMVTHIRKWGNSQGVRLTRDLLSTAGLDVGDAVDITFREGSLVVTPVRMVRGKLELAELVKQIPPDYQPEELDWGQPVGKEVW